MKTQFSKEELEIIKDAIEFSLIERKDKWIYETDAGILLDEINEK